MFKAEPAASTDFRDADGYDLVGACCSLESCGLRDFLPFTCPHCSRNFCQDHVAPAKHDCGQATQSQGMVAALCLHCGATVKWEDAASSEQEAMTEHLKVCKPLPQTARETCPAKGCKTKLNTMNSVVCPECKAKVCLKHRFEDHAYVASKELHVTSQKALPNRAAQNWGSGVTGSRVAAPQHAGEAKLSYNRSLSKSAREFELKLRVVESKRLVPEAPASKLLELRRALGNSEEAADERPGFACRPCAARRKLLSNVAADPRNPKFRNVKRENKAIQEKILRVPGGEELMRAIGFEDAGEMLSLPETVAPKRIEAILQLILS
ncbi:Zinc finger AN1 domain-containing stress-associated protein 17 [Symbiodinium microadriaticum]|uniref:Zinc finger AN1 domain-containing stress-associated protein 17 n=1 Tax=Symbiodinium microadriaticum TaxID=2951 RepID=A0A1Q9DII9_SYMMI|nr:Zinc finger AN1 domain-containing stress-associated protein 17 [Symbiodinium microadriaticum]